MAKWFIITCIVILLGSCMIAYAETYAIDEIVEAIGKAENGKDWQAKEVKYPYGIKSIDTKGDVEYAKQICKNSVVNNYKRWIKAGKLKGFLEFMRDRFCPLSDSKLNQYWVDNVKFWLVRARKEK